MSHTPITLDQYLGPYRDHPQMQSTILRQHGSAIIAAVNELCDLASKDGVELEDNPATKCAVAGEGNGGARPYDCSVGAPGSAHKDLRAVDRYDPSRLLAAWALSAGRVHVERLELFLEHPQWTRHWLHLQHGAPHSGNRVFVPYTDLVKSPPTCTALAEQKAAGVPIFAFKAAAK